MALNDDLVTSIQHDVCRRFGVEPVAALGDLKFGLARNVRESLLPINGLHHPPKVTPRVGISGPVSICQVTRISSSPSPWNT